MAVSLNKTAIIIVAFTIKNNTTEFSFNNLWYNNKESNVSMELSKSARPTKPATASVCKGWTVNNTDDRRTTRGKSQVLHSAIRKLGIVSKHSTTYNSTLTVWKCTALKSESLNSTFNLKQTTHTQYTV